jgi:hypothetical protein
MQDAGSKAADTTEDLSEAIEEEVQKREGEEVRSVRVYGDRYRCNFWVRNKSPEPMYLNTGHISRSKFFRVTRVEGKLVFEDLSIES